MKTKVLFNLGKTRQTGELIKVNPKTVLVKLDTGRIISRRKDRDRVELLKLEL